MTKVIVRTPSLARFRRLFFRSQGRSVLRSLEYERLSLLGLTGRVLDFGGGSKSNYAGEIMQWGVPGQGYIYESANIDPKIEPTHLIDQRGKVPVEDDFYDSVISLNTLEHVEDLQGAFTEIRRVLKPTGRLIFIVPFIFRVHGHPNDYPTPVGHSCNGGRSKKPVVVEDAIAIRPVMALALTFDNRVTDNRTGFRFIETVRENLEQAELP